MAAEESRRGGRLVHADPASFKIRRRRCGRGFSYIDERGKIIRDERLKSRFRRLAIPPAWTDVRLPREPNAHIQAVGRDSRGRQQYIYHPDWERHRASVKEQRLLLLGEALPRLRNAVRAALAKPQLTAKTVAAAVVRLIDRTRLRAGHDEYAKEHGTRGAASLLKSDVQSKGDTIIVDFQGKGGKHIHKEVRDPALARVIRLLLKLPGRRLFKAPGEHGEAMPVTASDVNRYIADRTGRKVTAKDFRTFEASAAALARLSAIEAGTEREQKRALAAVADEVGEELANTRSVARNSYIHPKVTRAYEAGKLRGLALKGHAVAGLNRMESALLRFLERQRRS